MPFRPFLAGAALALGLLASGQTSAGNAVQDLRQAAMLHRAGETAPALAIWQRRAEKGDADAAYNLGVIHHYGDGVARNPTEAMRWYRRAADLGDKASQFQIGLMYLNGEGVKADAKEAHHWFTAHRQHHMHHNHTPQMLAWRQQAATLLDQRDAREAMPAILADSSRVLAELKARAGQGADNRVRMASGVSPTIR